MQNTRLRLRVYKAKGVTRVKYFDFGKSKVWVSGAMDNALDCF